MSNNYDVFLLDVYLYDDQWVENDRYKIGKIEIDDKDTDKDILNKLKQLTFKDCSGHLFTAISSNDLRSVFVDHFDTTIEIGSKKNNRKPDLLLVIED